MMIRHQFKLLARGLSTEIPVFGKQAANDGGLVAHQAIKALFHVPTDLKLVTAIAHFGRTMLLLQQHSGLEQGRVGGAGERATGGIAFPIGHTSIYRYTDR